MILMLGLLPFFGVAISALILGYSGRGVGEKFTLFFYSPDDIGKDSAGLIAFLRGAFWACLILSVWMIIKFTSLP